MSTLAGRDFGVFGVFGLDNSALLLRLSLLGLDRRGVRTREVEGSSRSSSLRLGALVISDTSLSKVWVDTANSSSVSSSFWIFALLSEGSSDSFLLGCAQVTGSSFASVEIPLVSSVALLTVFYTCYFKEIGEQTTISSSGS